MSLTDAHFSVVSPPGCPDCVVKASGEIDIYTAPALRDVLQEALAAAPRKLVIELAEVTFLDSTGLSVIIHAFRRAQDFGCQFGLQSPTPRVVRLLELTGLHRVLPIALPPD
jgi:anti-anti-sigma factor